MTGALPWLLAFAVTQAIEIPVYMRFARLSFWRAAIPSSLTHPIAWFVFFHPAIPWSWLSALVAAELFAWLAESLILVELWREAPNQTRDEERPGDFAPALRLRREGYWKTFLLAAGISLLANSLSLASGLLSRSFFGVP